MTIDWWAQGQVFALTFTSVFLRGFQHKNVIGDHRKSIFVTSYLMAVCDVLFIGLVSQKGWSVCFAAGTGAALAMIAAIMLHDKLLKTKEIPNVGTNLSGMRRETRSQET